MKFDICHYERHAHRRGSIIVLVVAVLALLAIIGTVYIVSARTERGTAREMQASYNMDLAEQSLVHNIAQVISESSYDADGIPGGYASGAGHPFGTTAARRWTIGERDWNNPGTTSYNPLYRDQPWLVNDLYMQPTATSEDASFLTYFPYDPTTGQYSVSLLYNGQPSSLVPTATDLYVATLHGNVVNCISGYSSTNQGAYPDGISPTGIKYPVDPSVPSVPFADSYLNMLPYSEASGVRYRIAQRIIDTSRMANLNVGFAGNASPDALGTYLSSYPLGNPNIMVTGDSAASLEGGAAGRSPAANAPNVWTFQSLRLDFPSLNVFPFDVADELELRAYGNIGTTFTPRPALLMPNTLGNAKPGVLGNPNREFYTGYSKSRQLRPLLDPANAYTLGTIAIWPPSPAPVSVNPDLQAYLIASDPQKAADTLATTASNIATAMEISGFDASGNPLGYSHQEACAFAANYMTFRLNNWTNRTVGPVNVWSLITVASPTATTWNGGPSFIDNSGIVVHVPGGTGYKYVGATDLRAETTSVANKVYLGFAAQPFINELGATIVTAADPVTGALTSTVTDSAIELFNPFGQALDLQDYEISVNGGTPIDLGKFAGTKYIPARGYFVLSQSAAMDLLVSGANNQHDIESSFQLNVAGGSIVLLRKYSDRADASVAGAIDKYNYPKFEAAAAAGTENRYLRRANDSAALAPATPNPWYAAIHDPPVAELVRVDTGAGTEKMTLGDINPAGTTAPDVLPPTSFPLFDQYIDSPVAQQGAPLANIQAFNVIPRICNELDASANPALPAVTTPTVDHGLLSSQFFNKILVPDPAVANTDHPVEASVHFDFRAAPWIYQPHAVPAGWPAGLPADCPAPPGAPVKGGDIRAVLLLDSIAFIDRVSDSTIPNRDSTGALSKLAIPGQINVNTASGQVLAGLPGLSTQPNLVKAILAYRWRSASDGSDSRIPVTAPPYDFRDPVKYPGYGIRSLAELQFALTADTATSAQSILNRDAVWASIYNLCTVRSDTFIVYGYVEAVRQNPNHVGTLTAADWYVTDPAKITDDLNFANGSILLQRVARRRFVALIDSSNGNVRRYVNGSPNPLFAPPKIVAIKELPN
jgi:hypothetical protein